MNRWSSSTGWSRSSSGTSLPRRRWSPSNWGALEDKTPTARSSASSWTGYERASAHGVRPW
eukprot:10927757-Heterocapsa_arctica.AAC.1